MSQTEIERRILEVLTATLQQEDVPAGQRLDDAFQVIAAYRAARLKQPLSELVGPTVQSGPFAGMAFLDRVSEGAYIPKLLGSYEAELHGVIETACSAGYDTVVNVGCAEGYYAVGLARRLLSARVHAFDIDARAQQLCHQLAEMNGVADRLEIAGELTGSDFAKFATGRTLVLCDIEGAEVELLDPDTHPALRHMDLLVEIHRVGDAWTSDLLYPRFAQSHTVSEIQPEPRLATRYPALAGLDEVDRFFALLERIEPTRWAFLTATAA
jgi:hypothetical protein